MPRGDGPSSASEGRSAVTREAVLSAALRIVDEGGIEALTMRRVATELGVDPMTIYRYVDGKEALLDGVVEQVWNELPIPEPDLGWDDALRRFVDGLRAALRAHPRAASLVLTRPVMARASLEAFETLIDLLRNAGFDDRAAARLVRAVTMVVMSDIASSRSFHAMAEASPTPDATDTWITLARSLPADTPTNLVRTAALICAPEEADADVAFMIDLVLAGATALQQ